MRKFNIIGCTFIILLIIFLCINNYIEKYNVKINTNTKNVKINTNAKVINVFNINDNIGREYNRIFNSFKIGQCYYYINEDPFKEKLYIIKVLDKKKLYIKYCICDENKNEIKYAVYSSHVCLMEKYKLYIK